MDPAIIGVDLSADGAAAVVVGQMLGAIELMCEQHAWRAGDTPVRILRGAAADLVRNERVVALIGPFRSAEMAAALPSVNHQGVLAVSASNTYAPLTVPGPAFEADAPDRFFPHGPRTYVRLFPNDLHQAAALAQLARAEGIKRPYVLHDEQPYGLAIAEGFRRAAPAAGLAVAGFSSWHARGATDATADAYVLCGVPDGHEPSPSGKPVLACDAFVGNREMLVLTPGIVPNPATAFVSALALRLGSERGAVQPYAIYAAEAARLILMTLAATDGSRAAIREHVFKGHHAAVLFGGSYRVLASGDVAADGAGRAMLGFRVHRAGSVESMAADPALVSAAQPA